MDTKVSNFEEIVVIDIVNDKFPILDMSQTGSLRNRTTTPQNFILSLGRSAGSFSIDGDAQSINFTLRCKTTTNTGVEMALDGSEAYLIIPSGGIISCFIQVVGTKSDGSAVAHYLRQYSAKNILGTSSEVYSAITIGIDHTSNTSLSISTNDTDDYISIKPTGVENEVWRWVATVYSTEVAYGS